MATLAQLEAILSQHTTWINSVIANSKLPSELASQTDLDDPTDVMVVQRGLDDVKKATPQVVRGLEDFVFAEECMVRKDSGNTDLLLIEVNDEVFFKQITNAGDPLVLVGQTYNGGDKQIRASYTQDTAIDI